MSMILNVSAKPKVVGGLIRRDNISLFTDKGDKFPHIQSIRIYLGTDSCAKVVVTMLDGTEITTHQILDLTAKIDMGFEDEEYYANTVE